MPAKDPGKEEGLVVATLESPQRVEGHGHEDAAQRFVPPSEPHGPPRPKGGPGPRGPARSLGARTSSGPGFQRLTQPATPRAEVTPRPREPLLDAPRKQGAEGLGQVSTAPVLESQDPGRERALAP